MNNFIDDYYGSYRTNIFTDVAANDFTEANQHRWDDANNFKNDFKASNYFSSNQWTTKDVNNVTTTHFTDNEIIQIYWLLYAQYGNSVIAPCDEFRFKQRCFAIIGQYGPTWLSRLSIQKQLREIPALELLNGTKAIYNKALNPQSTPGTTSVEEVTYINQQDTSNIKKGKLEALADLWNMLDTDVTQEFLNKFKPLFMVVVSPDKPLLFGGE